MGGAAARHCPALGGDTSFRRQACLREEDLCLHELSVALGDTRYRVERPFGSWPQNPGFVTDVTVDPRGHVFVMLRHDPLLQPSDPRGFELSPEGRYLGGWGGP